MFSQQFIDARFARVVSCQRQSPIPEAVVEMAQVPGGGPGAFPGLQAFVHRFQGKAERAGGVGHQLEQADGACRAARQGIERRFDFGQPSQLRRKFFDRKDLFQPRHIILSERRQGTIVQFSDPDRPFDLRRRIRQTRRGQFLRRGFGFAAQLFGDIEVIKAGLQPDGQRACFFELLQHGKNAQCRFAKRAKVVNVGALEPPPEFGEELLHAILIDTQLIQCLFVEIVRYPLLDRLDDFVGLKNWVLGHGGESEEKPDQDGGNCFHAAQLNARKNIPRFAARQRRQLRPRRVQQQAWAKDQWRDAEESISRE